MKSIKDFDLNRRQGRIFVGGGPRKRWMVVQRRFGVPQHHDRLGSRHPAPVQFPAVVQGPYRHHLYPLHSGWSHRRKWQIYNEF